MTGQQTDFNIKLIGDLDGLDTTTFIDMISAYTLAIHQINDDMQTNRSLKIMVKTAEPGCFSIFLSIKEFFLDHITSYLTKENAIYAGEIVGFFIALLKLRSLLKGEEPKEVRSEGNQTVIVNGDGNSIVLNNGVFDSFKNNQLIDALLSRGFEALEADDSVKGIEVNYPERNESFKAERSEFKLLSKPAVLSEKDTIIKIDEGAVLRVFKVVFEKGFKWQFYYQGNKISADVKDETFYDLIDKGIKFSKGDMLVTELHIKQVFDKSLSAYINKEYIVAKVITHMPRSEQLKL